ncbi:hypothetical protein ARAM_003725 [Aspergillus rambellii]|uniref:Sugar transporter n=1 Tax=Aspergillus rambellii TaxID=308745 RepID=A0A0F8U703_9EURO|nr:hypothetical protein ARAM_003725 [Aspergillus rambellii]
MLFFVWFFVPETKGISLEKMDELFGVTSSESEDDDGPADKDDVAKETRVETV